MNKRTISITFVFIVLLGTFLFKPTLNKLLAPSNPPREEQNVLGGAVDEHQILGKSTEPSVRYEGKDGFDALTLLKKNASVDFEEYDFGKMVTEINGVKNTNKMFWMFYVNGKMAQVSADNYLTKDGDVIEWRYEEMK